MADVAMTIDAIAADADGTAAVGVVHAWVGQKLLNCYILRVSVKASYFHVSA